MLHVYCRGYRYFQRTWVPQQSTQYPKICPNTPPLKVDIVPTSERRRIRNVASARREILEHLSLARVKRSTGRELVVHSFFRAKKKRKSKGVSKTQGSKTNILSLVKDKDSHVLAEGGGQVTTSKPAAVAGKDYGRPDRCSKTRGMRKESGIVTITQQDRRCMGCLAKLQCFAAGTERERKSTPRIKDLVHLRPPNVRRAKCWHSKTKRSGHGRRGVAHTGSGTNGTPSAVDGGRPEATVIHEPEAPSVCSFK